ncbi:M56 family metallopeptidase [Oryzihumus sp.]
MLVVAALVLVALVLAGAAPRVMSRRTGFRRSPRPALVVWQCVSLAAVLAALAAGPAVIPATAGHGSGRAVVGGLALALSAGMLLRLLWSGHRVGTRLRAVRREHRELVDLLGLPDDVDAPQVTHRDGTVRVLAHPTPTAYCLPGLRRRVVLTRGALESLPPDQLAAVLAHERAHLRARHDLVLEFFTVLHRAVPPWLRSEAALAEVRLLVEVLADRAAVRVAGVTPVARALVTLAQGRHPEAAMAAGGGTALPRMELLAAAERPARWLSALMYAFAAAVIAVPVALVALAFA